MHVYISFHTVDIILPKCFLKAYFLFHWIYKIMSLLF